MLDIGPPVPRRPGDGDNIEPRAVFQQVIMPKKCQCDSCETTLFIASHGIGGMSRVMRATCLYFREDNGLAVHGDNVDFTEKVLGLSLNEVISAAT